MTPTIPTEDTIPTDATIPTEDPTRPRSRGSVLVPALLALAATGAALAPAAAQQEVEWEERMRERMEAAAEADLPLARPTPAPVLPPPYFREALERGTRSPDGSPGPAYWQNEADYEIHAELDPSTAEVRSRTRIVYHNRSPHALDRIVLHLHQNLHREGVVRNEAQEITGGVRLRSVAIDGRAADGGPEMDGGAGADGGPGGSGGGPEGGATYEVDGTIMTLFPASPVEPGGRVELEIAWSFTVPQSGAGRIGHSEREVYFVGYWFPKVAVFDDLRGWDAQPYLGNAEFYDSFDDYDVELTVPAGWTVMATGELRNPEEVYTARTRDRLAAAAVADTVVTVGTVEDVAAGRVVPMGPVQGASGEAGGAGASNQSLTWRFSAERVRDFTFTASNAQQWDAMSARVPDRDGDGEIDRVLVHTFWRPDRAPVWREQVKYARHAVEFHSRFTGFPYPWPHMTSVEGTDIIGGGMEFPMLTVMGPYTQQGDHGLYNVTSHEIAHMWIPMIVGTNEKRWAWMDEGSTSFLENQGRPEYWADDPADSLEALNYIATARMEAEQPLMRHGDYYEPGPGYGTASYPKPATLLVTLRNVIGSQAFEEGYRAFISEWAYRHPTPWDFFNTFERAAGRDLDWFWTPWYFETWTLDQAVGSVEEGPDGTTIVIEDRGWAPMPTRVHVTTTEGGEIVREIPVEHWLRGETRAELTIPASAGPVTFVEVDPFGLWPDVAWWNNLWMRGGDR